MALINFGNVRKSYILQEVLKGVSFSVGQGDRTALVGPNGCGKSTLLRILVGLEEPDSGSAVVTGGVSVGYLAQENELDRDGTVYEAVLEARPGLSELQADLARREAELPALRSEALDRATAEYADALHRFQEIGGYEAEAEAKTILAGLGLTGDELDRPVRVLSGGQKTRVCLARLLFQGPRILVLDEPTNHLDLEATEWLESYLKAWSGTLLLVSHDRVFLDAVATEVVDLTDGVARAYKGNYSQYVAQKELEERQQQEAYERQQQEIAKLEAYIRRYKAGNRATMAKSRENRLSRLERLSRPRAADTIHFKIAPASRSGRYVVELKGAEKRYDDLVLFRGLDLVIQRGERVGVVGPNGSGKSTLIKCIIGDEELTEGEVVLGHGVTVGTFGQQHEHLEETNIVLDEVLMAGEMLPAQARNLLAQFLFRGDDVFKPVSALSGGERNRLILCKLLVSAPNLLVLDEPTNHLDLWSRQALEKALADYSGTLIFASHDRYLLHAIANRIVHVKGGKAVPYDLTYDEWRAYTAPPPPPIAPRKPKKPAAPEPAKPRRANPKRDLARLEEEITRVEGRLAELTALLGDVATYTDGSQASALTQEYDALSDRLKSLNSEWEVLAEQVLAA